MSSPLYSIGRSSTYKKTRSTLHTMADHVFTDPLVKGVFVPTSTAIDIDVALASQFSGVAHVGAFFIWNQTVAPGAELLTGAGAASGWTVAGTSQATVGPFSGDAVANTSRRLRITGLTAGVPVTWALIIGATGYYETLNVGAFPNDVALSIDGRTAYVAVFTDNKLSVVNVGDRWYEEGISRVSSEITTQSGAYGVCVHPTDATKIYLSRFSANQVVQLNPSTGAVTKGPYSVTGPYWVITNSDGTKLFVIRQSANVVVPITLATDTIGSNITVPNGPWKPVRVGNYIYVPCSTGNAISRINTTDNTVTNLTVTGPVAIAANHDGTKLWAVRQAANLAVEIDVATFALTGNQISTSTAKVDLAVSPTSKSLVVIGGTGKEFQTFVLPQKGTVYEEADIANGLNRVVITPDGDIIALSSNGNLVHHWHSAKTIIDPSNGFWGSFAEVLVSDSTAGTND